MAQFKSELLVAARSRLGAPFQHHFRPDDLCSNGTATVGACMERGLGNPGYDCSGLVIASICDVFGMDISDWPEEYRHALQFKDAANPDLIPEPGDVVFLQAPEDPSRKHVGIYAGGLSMVHASGVGEVREVIEGDVLRSGQVAYVVDPFIIAGIRQRAA